MRHFIHSILFIAALNPLQAADTFLVENGEPVAEIVIAEKSARMTKLAAKELQSTLLKMTGATLPISSERTAGKMAIFVGMSRFTEERGLSTQNLKHGAFRMASGKDWLALLGADKDFVPIEHGERALSALPC
jgi:hypothetical protein